MSIASEISRLQTAKADLKTAIEGKGVTVPSATTIDGYADLVDEIETGGGGKYTIDDIATQTGISGDIELLTTTIIKPYAFYEDTAITSLKSLVTTTLGTYMCYGCTSLKTVVLCLPTSNVISVNGSRHFMNSTALEVVDCMIGGFGSSNSNIWNGCSALKTLILRKTSGIVTLSVNSALTGTPFASNGTGGTLYVPQALISSYEAATNWSTILGYANNSIAAIEGSQYEDYYADGTPIT